MRRTDLESPVDVLDHTYLQPLVDALYDNSFECHELYEHDDMIVYEGKFGQDYMVQFCNLFPSAIVDTSPYAPWVYFHIDTRKDSECAENLSWLVRFKSVFFGG